MAMIHPHKAANHAVHAEAPGDILLPPNHKVQDARNALNLESQQPQNSEPEALKAIQGHPWADSHHSQIL